MLFYGVRSLTLGPTPKMEGPGFYFKVYSPATCFVWLLHWGLFGLGNPTISYINISIAPSSVKVVSPSEAASQLSVHYFNSIVRFKVLWWWLQKLLSSGKLCYVVWSKSGWCFREAYCSIMKIHLYQTAWHHIPHLSHLQQLWMQWISKIQSDLGPLLRAIFRFEGSPDKMQTANCCGKRMAPKLPNPLNLIV
jgi:hypothetical protein